VEKSGNLVLKLNDIFVFEVI